MRKISVLMIMGLVMILLVSCGNSIDNKKFQALERVASEVSTAITQGVNSYNFDALAKKYQTEINLVKLKNENEKEKEFIDFHIKALDAMIETLIVWGFKDKSKWDTEVEDIAHKYHLIYNPSLITQGTLDNFVVELLGITNRYITITAKMMNSKDISYSEKDVLGSTEKYYYDLATIEDTIVAFEKYLNKYPNGEYVSEANSKIEKIKARWGKNMILVKGGTFQMGSNENSDEKPIHSVTLDDFYINKYEVTQKEWKEVMGSNPSNPKSKHLPVNNLSWNLIQKFLIKLNAKTGANYRLPTEAEWEYAAKGGNKSRGYKYSGSNNINRVAWYKNSDANDIGAAARLSCYAINFVQPTGIKQPNELGIYDMSGNVGEWCSDWYGKNYYSNSPSNNPQGPSSGSSGSGHIYRGGSYSCQAYACQTTSRGHTGWRFKKIIGFRLVLAP